jgi:hypothetical protein
LNTTRVKLERSHSLVIGHQPLGSRKNSVSGKNCQSIGDKLTQKPGFSVALKSFFYGTAKARREDHHPALEPINLLETGNKGKDFAQNPRFFARNPVSRLLV